MHYQILLFVSHRVTVPFNRPKESQKGYSCGGFPTGKSIWMRRHNVNWSSTIYNSKTMTWYCGHFDIIKGHCSHIKVLKLEIHWSLLNFSEPPKLTGPNKTISYYETKVRAKANLALSAIPTNTNKYQQQHHEL